jgi:hypothetical protein
MSLGLHSDTLAHIDYNAFQKLELKNIYYSLKDPASILCIKNEYPYKLHLFLTHYDDGKNRYSHHILYNNINFSLYPSGIMPTDENLLRHLDEKFTHDNYLTMTVVSKIVYFRKIIMQFLLSFQRYIKTTIPSLCLSKILKKLRIYDFIKALPRDCTNSVLLK